jgi:hypothetical protein
MNDFDDLHRGLGEFVIEGVVVFDVEFAPVFAVARCFTTADVGLDVPELDEVAGAGAATFIAVQGPQLEFFLRVGETAFR